MIFKTVLPQHFIIVVNVILPFRVEGGECAIAHALGKIFEKQYSMRPLSLLVSLSSDAESCTTVIEGALTAAVTFMNVIVQEASSGSQKAQIAGDIAVALPLLLHTLASPHEASSIHINTRTYIL